MSQRVNVIILMFQCLTGQLQGPYITVGEDDQRDVLASEVKFAVAVRFRTCLTPPLCLQRIVC